MGTPNRHNNLFLTRSTQVWIHRMAEGNLLATSATAAESVGSPEISRGGTVLSWNGSQDVSWSFPSQYQDKVLEGL